VAVLPWVNENEIANAHRLLFHYTSAKVLGPILRSGGLYATDYRRTNDRLEARTLRRAMGTRMLQMALPALRARLKRGAINLRLTAQQLGPIVRGDAERFFSR
jgi:hypothetical protein